MLLAIIKFTASMLVGLIPGPRGTWGSLLTLMLAGLWLKAEMAPLDGFPYLVFIAGLSLMAVAISEIAVRNKVFGERKDPGQIVIDEAAGMLVALYGTHALGWRLITAFALFRLFDISKPFPIGVSQKLPGGWGIVIDDILAGLYSLAVIWLLVYLDWLPSGF